MAFLLPTLRECLALLIVATGSALVLAQAPTPAPADESQPTLPPAASRPIDFVRDVQPIFANSCLKCHGEKKQRGGLRLDQASSLMIGGDGGPVIVVGKGDQSRLIQFVAGLDEDNLMPPEGQGNRLSAEQVGLLRAWVDQGAKWPVLGSGSTKVKSDHWSFRKPVAPAVPEVKDQAWSRNPIDRFVLARIEKEGLNTSPEADRTTLIRRVSLDLTGLPPTLGEIDRFLNDRRPDAYEALVDRLLASPRYGERWGRRWLDRARYADTNGYEKDRERSIWPYRDWVINALNADMPFDRFTVEQVAGDLLPQPTAGQRIATGFHRNTMTNEEGGIDVEEFRFASVVDRVATTSAVWLGLTVGCAQCHTHKFDPITQREYYQVFAFLNNADEPDLEIADADVAERRTAIEVRIAALEAARPNRFPERPEAVEWHPLKAYEAKTTGPGKLSIKPDRSVVASGPVAEVETYTLTFDLEPGAIDALRIEALTDAALPSKGPGRTPHGNFVLTDVKASVVSASGERRSVRLKAPKADFTQKEFDPAGTLDGNPRTGWAIDDGSGHLNKNREIAYGVESPRSVERGARLVLSLEQQYGGKHVLGKLRVSTGRERPAGDDSHLTVAERRRKHLDAKQKAWEAAIQPTHWTAVAPSSVSSKKHATMIVLADKSVLATGDKPNNDSYRVELPAQLKGVSAIRLEVLPDPSLPARGPGRAPLFSVGDFILTELSMTAERPGEAPKSLKLQNASEDFAQSDHSAALAIDGKGDTGWSIQGGVGQAHHAVFELAEPAGVPVSRLVLNLEQFGIHQMTIGRFRVSVTTDPAPIRSAGVPSDVEAALATPRERRSGEERRRIEDRFLAVAPELAAANGEIEALRRSIPEFRTSMVMVERPAEHARTTRIHKRGEFLKPAEPVSAATLGVLHALPSGERVDRLAFARWLVSDENPLVARVVMNREWQAFFGRGIVPTIEDFGTRGEPASHPELLDWLAVEFPRRGWGLKAMHRLIVTSATYRQSSKADAEQVTRDPRNEWLARGARFRVEAEVVRDLALASSGLLYSKIGGPSVFPPQPEGVGSLAYGQPSWPTSVGPNRYRRGLYTFTKRTAPYAAFMTFDAPTSETTCVRRERSNTPLQALTLLNDTVYLEASRGLAERVLAGNSRSDADRMAQAFRLCMGRFPRPDEATLLTRFQAEQRKRFDTDSADADKVAGLKSPKSAEVASWTVTARVLFNLDEFVTRE